MTFDTASASILADNLERLAAELHEKAEQFSGAAASVRLIAENEQFRSEREQATQEARRLLAAWLASK